VQIIGNTSDRPLWLSVSQGECTKAAKIEAKQNAVFSCDVPNLKPGRVPVVITVFADEARTETLETHRDEFRFSASDIRKILALAATDTASEVASGSDAFDGIAFSEKLGVGAALRQSLGYAKGTLAISSSTINTPTASARSRFRSRACATFGCGRSARRCGLSCLTKSREMKRAGFLAVRDRDDLPRILRLISTAALNAIEPVADETLAERVLQRDTRMTILEFEKVAASDAWQRKSSIRKSRSGLPTETSERWLVDRCGRRSPTA
jgi:hypothetical protein